jgi:hypothetical protein
MNIRENCEGSVGMRMREKYSPKRGMRMGIGNILDGRARNGKISSGQLLTKYLQSLIEPRRKLKF